jgi:hypothetical protein
MQRPQIPSSAQSPAPAAATQKPSAAATLKLPRAFALQNVVSNDGTYVIDPKFDNVDDATGPALNISTNSACLSAALNPRGLRSSEFKTCFSKHMSGIVRPLMNKANRVAHSGNAQAMDAVCRQDALAPHQLVTFELAKIFAAAPPEKMGEHRGLLTFHNTGSGKTLTALAIAVAFWPSKKRIYLVTSKANRDFNDPKKYAQNIIRFFPAYAHAIIAAHRKAHEKNSGLTDDAILERAFQKRVQFLSFRQATHAVHPEKKDGGEFKKWASVPALWEGPGSVLLIDEAQGLATQGSRDDPKGEGYRFGTSLRSLNKVQLRKVHVFALTATPGSTIKEWLALASLVRRADQSDMARDAPELEESIKKAVRTSGTLATVSKYVQDMLGGLVSYVDMRSDLSRHACIKEITYRVPMDKWYYLAYLNAMSTLRLPAKGVDQAHFKFDPRKPDRYMRKMRALGNFMPATAWSWVPRHVHDAFRHQNMVIVDGNQKKLVSEKFVRLVKALVFLKGKQYVYTVGPRLSTEATLALALEMWGDFEDVTERVVKFGSRGLKPTGKNFVIIKDEGLTGSSGALENLKKSFDHPDNLRGEYIKIIIATGRYYEGLDVRGLRYVHISEPLHTSLAEVQAIGRGVRNCAHEGLPVKERTVTVIRWYSVAPLGVSWPVLEKVMASRALGSRGGSKSTSKVKSIRHEFESLPDGKKSVDELVHQRSQDDIHTIVLVNFENVVKASAIDCSILGRYHGGKMCTVPEVTRSSTMSAGKRCSA